MLIKPRRVFYCAVAIGAVLLASCGGSETTITVEQETSLPALTSEPTPTGEPTTTTQDSPTSIGECGAPASEITLGSPVSTEIFGADQPPKERKFFCVIIPEGASSITLELTETTADLNLYVGHPDLETVQEGGLWFWYSDERGVEDKVVVVQPGVTEYVNHGPYYIEVSAEDFSASSMFTLSVQTP